MVRQEPSEDEEPMEAEEDETNDKEEEEVQTTHEEEREDEEAVDARYVYCSNPIKTLECLGLLGYVPYRWSHVAWSSKDD